MHSPASPRLAHCRAFLETLTLVLSRCERERRASCAQSPCKRDVITHDVRTRCYGDGGGRTILDALFRLAPIAGERTEVRGLILLFEDSVGS